MGDDGDRLINEKGSGSQSRLEDSDSGPRSWNKLKEKKCRIPISNSPNLWRKKRSCSSSKETSGDALKKRLSGVKKQIREEQRKLNERRAALLGHCMMQKLNSDPESKNAILLDLYGFLSKPEDRELFGLPPK